jgi:Flp pilus assembly protein TadD
MIRSGSLLLAVLACAGSRESEAQRTAAHQLIRQGRVAEAIPFLERARSLDPSDSANNYDLALAYFKAGKLLQARQQAQATLAAKENAEMRNLLGDIEAAAGNKDGAAREFHRAAELDPSEKHLFDLGNHLLAHGALESALQTFIYGTEKHPSSSQLFVSLGVAFYARRDYDRAVEALCKGADLAPDDPRPFEFLGKMHGVSPALDDQVRARMKAFVEKHPDQPAARFHYAASLGEDDPQVEPMLREVIARRPTFAPAHLHLASVYERTGRTSDATREYREALRLDPQSSKAHYRLAQLYLKQGRRTAAQPHLDRYRQLREQEAKGRGGAGSR